MKKLVLVLLVAVMCACALGSTSAEAAWPKDKPFTMLIPFATGGGTDFNARLVGRIMADILDVRVNCINRTGGQGVVGHTAIAKGEADGYTLGDIEDELTTMHWAGLTDLTYRDLTPLAMIVSVGGAVFVRQDAPYKDMKELIAAIKLLPGRLKASGASHGGIWHLCEAGMLQAEGLKVTDVVWVPNEGAAPSLQDLAAGGLDFVVCTPNEAASLIDAKKVRPLCTITKDRIKIWPDVPTLKEATGSDWILNSWSGIAAPGAISPEMKKNLADAVKKVWETKEFQETMIKAGKQPSYLGPDEFKAFLAQMDENYGKVMKSVGLAK